MKQCGDRLTQLFLFCGILAPPVMMIAILVIGQITPNYDPISDSISRMGTPDKPYAMMLHGGYFIYGILMLMATYGLYRIMDHTDNVKKIAILLGIHAVGTVLLAIFPDSIDTPYKHVIHDVMSTTCYLPLLLSILVFRRITRYREILRVLDVLALSIIVINLPMPVINIVSFLRPIGGLLQRFLIGTSFLWLTLIFYLLHKKDYLFKEPETQLNQGRLTLESALR